MNVENFEEIVKLVAERNSENKLIVAGVDPGSRKAAVAVLDDEGNILLTRKFSSSTRDLWVRKLKFYDFLKGVFEEIKVDFVFVERPFVYHNTRSTMVLAEFIGIVDAVCMELRLRPFQLSASQVKSLSVGKRVSKELAQSIIRGLYPEAKGFSSDEIDAVAVALAGMNVVKEALLFGR